MIMELAFLIFFLLVTSSSVGLKPTSDMESCEVRQSVSPLEDEEEDEEYALIPQSVEIVSLRTLD